ncbi:hypothetical protein E1N66_19375 [Pantoea allii]|nr:hypothetical protein [Pantoea allii]THB82733.1 hypothetical protein E1N66_19375 [Pantoea allii]
MKFKEAIKNKFFVFQEKKDDEHKQLVSIKDAVNADFRKSAFIGGVINYLAFATLAISVLTSAAPSSLDTSTIYAALLTTFLTALVMSKVSFREIEEIMDKHLMNIPENLRRDVYVSILDDNNLKLLKKHWWWRCYNELKENDN